ncbi:MAG: glycosyltransferase [Ginsengibacter sp.]
MTDPLISCLCVTRHKPHLLTRAIRCFLGQTYGNKELLIVCESDDLETVELVSCIKDDMISLIVVDVHPKRTLGELRNLSIAAAKGDFFCQWDDDDWYHSKRLELQFKFLNDYYKSGSVLVNWIIFDELKREAYLSYTRAWEGSILCKKEIVDKEHYYDHLTKGEDTFFLFKLLERNCLVPIMMPYLYIYVIHGSNTWQRQHFDNMLLSCQKLSSQSAVWISEILKGNYSPEEASEILLKREIQEEFDYFNAFKGLKFGQRAK